MFYHLNCCSGQHYTVLHVTCYPLSGSALDHNVNWRIRLGGRLLCNIEPSCSTNRQLALHQNQIYNDERYYIRVSNNLCGTMKSAECV